jgi:N-acetyl-D-muramate 6-phosphate phosphatase
VDSALFSLPAAPKIKAVLFDLDGTFADTAPDMARAINAVRAHRGLAALPLAQLRRYVSNGARGMVRAAFDIKPEDVGFAALRQEFLVEYERAICVHSTLFDGMLEAVTLLEQRNIAWGIVTNKIARHSAPLVRAFGVETRAACVVSGDTCARAKPFPDPLLHAARLMNIEPAHCLYIGDDIRDIQAAHAAGMRSVAALYGYLGDSHPASWNATASIHSPADIVTLL